MLALRPQIEQCFTSPGRLTDIKDGDIVKSKPPAKPPTKPLAKPLAKLLAKPLTRQAARQAARAKPLAKPNAKPLAKPPAKTGRLIRQQGSWSWKYMFFSKRHCISADDFLSWDSGLMAIVGSGMGSGR